VRNPSRFARTAMSIEFFRCCTTVAPGVTKIVAIAAPVDRASLSDEARTSSSKTVVPAPISRNIYLMLALKLCSPKIVAGASISSTESSRHRAAPDGASSAFRLSVSVITVVNIPSRMPASLSRLSPPLVSPTAIACRRGWRSSRRI